MLLGLHIGARSPSSTESTILGDLHIHVRLECSFKYETHTLHVLRELGELWVLDATCTLVGCLNTFPNSVIRTSHTYHIILNKQTKLLSGVICNYCVHGGK